MDKVQHFVPVKDCWWWGRQRKKEKKRLWRLPPFTSFLFSHSPGRKLLLIFYSFMRVRDWGKGKDKVKGGRLPNLYFFFMARHLAMITKWHYVRAREENKDIKGSRGRWFPVLFTHKLNEWPMNTKDLWWGHSYEFVEDRKESATQFVWSRVSALLASKFLLSFFSVKWPANAATRVITQTVHRFFSVHPPFVSCICMWWRMGTEKYSDGHFLHFHFMDQPYKDTKEHRLIH